MFDLTISCIVWSFTVWEKALKYLTEALHPLRMFTNYYAIYYWTRGVIYVQSVRWHIAILLKELAVVSLWYKLSESAFKHSTVIHIPVIILFFSFVFLRFIFYDLQTSANGQVLVDKVCDHINLAERDYFSVSYRDRADVKVGKSDSYTLSKAFSSLHFVSVFSSYFLIRPSWESMNSEW